MNNIEKVGKKKLERDTSRGWVSTKSRRRFVWSSFIEVLRACLREYCESSSLIGYRYLVEPHRSWIERAMWIVVQATMLCTLGIIVNSAYREYLDVPVVTVIDSDNYPSNELEFPGIVICNINRISRKAAIEMANEIVSSNVTSMKFTDVLHLLRQLGSLYDSEINPDPVSEKDLDKLLVEYYKGQYDVTNIMKKLSPTCTDGLLTCIFQGQRKNCSDIFAFRKTQDGFCCTFNYVREPDDLSTNDMIKMEEPSELQYINSLGVTNGLSVVMEPFAEDYFYPVLPIMGWKVTIFNAHDYPDTESGSVDEALLSPATETFVRLDVTSFYSKNDIRSVSVEKRECIFPDELPVLYAGYTYSDCLVDCRAAVVWDTCNCRPFYLPRRGDDQYNRKICNMRDTDCLRAHEEIYSTVLSAKVKDFETNASEYEMNPETEKLCKGCWPACNDVRYYLRSTATYLDRGLYHTELLDEVWLVNQSIVHIFFTKHGSVRLRQESSYYWYELLSNIGGICGVFIGFSLISVVEFVYFALRMMREFCRGKKEEPIGMRSNAGTTTRKNRTCTKRRTRGNVKRSAGTLYWNEFLPCRAATLYDPKIQRFQVQQY